MGAPSERPARRITRPVIVPGGRIALLILLATLTSAARGHPDLILQIEELDVQLKSQPGNVELLVKRGDLYRRHQDYTAAAQDFNAARSIDPSNPEIDFYAGRLALAAGNGVEAEQLLARYLAHYPQHAAAWALRGEANIQIRSPGAAAEYFAQAIRYSNRPSPGLYSLNALSLVAIGESSWTGARQVIDEALQHFPLELTLLGLGVDIALALDLPAEAAQYMQILPQALRDLPQWKKRQEAADWLASAESAARAQCLRQANARLAKQIEAFMP
jgi:tetratricopeptide (TPR) repeat protein